MTVRSLGSLAVGLFLFTSALASQTPPAPPGAATPGPPPPRPQAPRTPPRDAAAPDPTGTARIRGRVVAAETGNPLQRAQIRVMAPELRQGRNAVAGADGRYEIDNLPPGRYSIFVVKPGFIELQFGQKRAFESGRPLDLKEGQVADRIDFALPRGGVIAGRLTDERGEPAAAVAVQAMRYTYLPSGTRQLSASRSGGPFGAFLTDDLGQFRIYGLLPGTYLVTGGAAPGLSSGNLEFGTTYYPGTVSADQAEAVTVGLGEEVSANFSLVPMRLAKISGVVVNSQGVPVPRRMLTLGARTETSNWSRSIGATMPDGTFSIQNLAPGEYSIDVTPLTMSGIVAPQDVEFASVPFVVSGDDISGLVIATRVGAVVTGRVVFQGTATRPTAPLQIFPTAAEPTGGPSRVSAGGRDNGIVDASGRFRITGVNGKVLFRTSGEQWFLKSVAVNGVDVTDVGYDVSNDVEQVEVVLTDRQTVVAGTVKNARGEPIDDYVLAIFPSDVKLGVSRSRFIRTVRPDQQGRYVTKGLPPARYFAIAVGALEQGAHYDPAFQQQVRPKARTFTLNEGETLSLDLTLIE